MSTAEFKVIPKIPQQWTRSTAAIYPSAILDIQKEFAKFVNKRAQLGFSVTMISASTFEVDEANYYTIWYYEV